MSHTEHNWLDVEDLYHYFNDKFSKDTIRNSMDLPFARLSKKLMAVHIEDLQQWELEKRGIIGESRSSVAVRAIPLPSELRQKRSNGKRKSSTNTSVGELESLLNTRSGRQ